MKPKKQNREKKRTKTRPSNKKPNKKENPKKKKKQQTTKQKTKIKIETRGVVGESGRNSYLDADINNGDTSLRARELVMSEAYIYSFTLQRKHQMETNVTRVYKVKPKEVVKNGGERKSHVQTAGSEKPRQTIIVENTN
jgi:fructose-specific phosphotransferase system component IIB